MLSPPSPFTLHTLLFALLDSIPFLVASLVLIAVQTTTTTELVVAFVSIDDILGTFGSPFKFLPSCHVPLSLIEHGKSYISFLPIEVTDLTFSARHLEQETHVHLDLSATTTSTSMAGIRLRRKAGTPFDILSDDTE